MSWASRVKKIISICHLGNLMIELKPELWRRSWTVIGLLGSLLIAYLIPFRSISGSTRYVGSIVALTFAIPVFFAGLLFAEEFRITDSPSSALAANMLGAVCGGLLENLSLVVGMRALLPITIGLYVLAVCGLGWRRFSSPAAVPLADST